MNAVEDASEQDVSKRKARELVFIDGKEVSLVDKPAIRRKFLVVKQEDGGMGIFEAEADDATETTPKNEEGTNTDGADLDTEMEASFAEVVKAFDGAEGWDLVDIEKAKVPADFAASVKAAMPAFRKTLAGLEGDERKAASKALSFLNKVAAGKLPFPNFLKPGKSGGGKTKTTKSEDGMADDVKTTTPSVQISPDGTIQINGEPIAKAKQFTSERIESLKATLGNLAGLLNDAAGIDAVKAALAQGLPGSDLPKDVSIPSSVRPAETPGVKKSEDDDGKTPDVDALTAVVTKALEPITSKMKELGEKVEAIEKTREAPQGEGGNESGDDGKTDVEKSEGSMWGSIL